MSACPPHTTPTRAVDSQGMPHGDTRSDARFRHQTTGPVLAARPDYDLLDRGADPALLLGTTAMIGSVAGAAMSPGQRP